MSALKRLRNNLSTVTFRVLKDDGDFAQTGDWSPQVGEVVIQQAGGTGSNTTNLPSVNGRLWSLALTATELDATIVDITIVATGIQDQGLRIETLGGSGTVDPSTNYPSATGIGNFQSFYDNNGGASLKTQDDVGSSQAAPTNKTADSATVTAGNQTNTFTATQNRDGTDHILTAAGGTGVDLFYEFQQGVGFQGSSVTLFGSFVTNINRTIDIFAFNYVTLNWDLKLTANNTTDTELTFTLNEQQTGQAGAGDDGNVRIRFFDAGNFNNGDACATDEIFVTGSLIGTGTTPQEIATAVRQNLPEAVYTNGAVYIDTLDGNAGSVPFINGSVINPVDNLADALSLNTQLNTESIVVSAGSTLTLDNNMPGFSIIGTRATMTFASVPTMNATAFVGGTYTGSFTFDVGFLPSFTGVTIDNVTGAAVMQNCSFINDGTPNFTISATVPTPELVVTSCSNVSPAVEPAVIDLNNVANALVLIDDYNGRIRFINGAATAIISMDDMAGNVEIDATCDNAMQVTISGLATLDDERANPDEDVLFQKARIDNVSVQSYQGQVFIATASGFSGTNYPIGTQQAPVDNLTDAKTIADANGFKTFRLARGDTITLNADFSGYTFIGDADIIGNSQLCLGSGFLECDVSGSFICDAETDFTRCSLKGCVAQGEFNNCAFKLADSLTLNGDSTLVQCYSELVSASTAFTIATGSNRIIRINGFFGDLEVKDMQATTTVFVDAVFGRLTLGGSVAGPVVNISGVAELVDNSSATVNDIARLDTTAISTAVAANPDPDVAAIKAQTDQMNFTGANIDADIKAVNAIAAAAVTLETNLGSIIVSAVNGTVNTPTATVFETDIPTALAPNTSQFRWRRVVFLDGSLIGQIAEVQDSVLSGALIELTTGALTGAPSNGDAFMMI